MKALNRILFALALPVMVASVVVPMIAPAAQEPKVGLAQPLRKVAEGVPHVVDDAGNQWPTGRVNPTPEQLRRAHMVSMKYAGKMKVLESRGVPDEFDCEKFGLVPPIKDQGPCGSCHIFSALGPATCAQIKAGNWKNEGDGYSEQEQLDCKPTGGCSGGWEWDDAEFLLQKGGAKESEYGPYQARSRTCKSGVKLFKTDDMAMCSPGVDGVARAIDIQNSIIEHGPVSISVAADNGFSSYRGGLFNGTGSRSVNHAVVYTGWKTVSGKIYFKLRNSWGTGWGEKGYMWCLHGANQAGGDAFWVSVKSVNPPLPPDPGPGPDPGPFPPGGKSFTLKGFGVHDGEYRLLHPDMKLGDILEAMKAGKAAMKVGGSVSEPCNDEARWKRQEELNTKLVEIVEQFKKIIGTHKAALENKK